MSRRVIRARAASTRPAIAHPTEAAGALRAGMSLLEMLIALLLLTIIVAAALRVLDTQLRGFTAGNERMAVLQNFRFAANVLDQHIRTAGMGVPGQQPFLIYAGENVIAFNADYATNDENDPFAVYRRLDAPNEEVMSLTRARRIQIPTTAAHYPDTTYFDGPAQSTAETIIFYFEPDSTADAPGSYVLKRQVNAEEPEVVARNLKRLEEDAPFFEYLRIEGVETGAPSLHTVPAANLPMHHAAPIHGSAADTGRFALIDDVRAVRVRFTATNGMTGDHEQSSPITRLIRMPNAGLAIHRTCGDSPIFNRELVAEVVSSSPDPDIVRLRWLPAVDETGGERDVIRYVIWRKLFGASAWAEPLVSIPAGMPSYEFNDTRIPGPGVYVYGVAAQDCTPALSPIVESLPVTIVP